MRDTTNPIKYRLPYYLCPRSAEWRRRVVISSLYMLPALFDLVSGHTWDDCLVPAPAPLGMARKAEHVVVPTCPWVNLRDLITSRTLSSSLSLFPIWSGKSNREKSPFISHIMRYLFSVCAFLPLVATSTNVVLSNDDGWAEKNVRTFYNGLVTAGDSVVLSAPADNKSGTGMLLPALWRQEKDGPTKTPIGSSDAPATPLTKPCEFNTCPAGSPAQGSDSSNHRLNYVNSYPVTSMRYGIQTLSPKYFGQAPDIAVAGPNVGGLFLSWPACLHLWLGCLTGTEWGIPANITL